MVKNIQEKRIRVRTDVNHKFVSIFRMSDGFSIRSGIFDKDGKETNEDPFMGSGPELIDIGIMGHCEHGKSGLCIKSSVQCYQSGLIKEKPNMPLSSFQKIIKECKDTVFQVALGGRGDPDMHENFEDILKTCRENFIIPNFTSSGLKFTPEKAAICKKYTGSVAISWYRSEYTLNAIKMLQDAGVLPNIQYVLNTKTIDEAITRLQANNFPKGIKAIIFLLHKPVGLGRSENILTPENPKVLEFFDIIDNLQGKIDFQVGFDSCSIPGIINFTKNTDNRLIDTCEGARFSMYISADMKAMPCSFDQDFEKWHFDISEKTINDAWNSDQFNDFRNRLLDSCPDCKDRKECFGGCPIVKEIVLCNRKERSK